MKQETNRRLQTLSWPLPGFASARFFPEELEKLQSDRVRRQLRQLVRDINALDGIVPVLETKKNLIKTRINKQFKHLRIGVSLNEPGKFGWDSELSAHPRFPGQWKLWIWNMAAQGSLRAIRECSCGKLFYSRKHGHKFCSDRCREKDFRGSPQGREKRRNYMRKYREGLRRRDVENIRVGKRPSVSKAR